MLRAMPTTHGGGNGNGSAGRTLLDTWAPCLQVSAWLRQRISRVEGRESGGEKTRTGDVGQSVPQ